MRDGGATGPYIDSADDQVAREGARQNEIRPDRERKKCSRSLSHREHACMALIAAFDLVEERAPSLREIAKGLGLNSETQAVRIVQSLMRHGLIARIAGSLQISQVQSFQAEARQ